MLWNALKCFGDRIRDEDLAKPAIIFSPHPDDETLGCGGTIIRKKKAGANVKIVFMTDGSSSHRKFISDQQLKSMRMKEALSACHVLGVHSADVRFLEFKDQHLQDFRNEAIDEVANILAKEDCDEIFIPYARDNTPDHVATNAIVMAAAEASDKKLVIYEYPIWFWHHWPWTSLRIASRSDIIRQVGVSIVCWLALFQNFRCFVPINAVLERKRMALNQHQSQMTRPAANPRWPILNDVSHGDFLQCFFRECEIFRKRQVG